MVHDAATVSWEKDKARDAFAAHQPSDLLFTNLSSAQEDALREVFAS